jgi:hypothetical protein
MVAVDSMCCHAGSPFRKDKKKKKNLKERMEIAVRSSLVLVVFLKDKKS